MAARPNVLLVVVHDLGTHLRCYGETTVYSLNLDALAARGVRCSQHFATAPYCSPSRGAIITGRWPHSNGLLGLVNLGWDLPAANTTLAQMLGGAGFETFLFGLQHEVKDVSRLGFDHVRPCPSRRCADVAPAVVDFLRTRPSQGAPPFYARVGLSEVHRLGDGYMPYESRAPDPSTVNLPAHLADTPGARQEIAQFHACVNEMDSAVGTILDAVAASGHGRDTIVVFTTDHGLDFPRAKATLYDPGIRTTLIAHWPGRWEGGIVHEELLSNIDLLPTLLDAVGAPVPACVQGRSFLPLLDGEPCGANDAIFAEKNTTPDDTKRCVRTKDWKYIRNFDEGPLLQLTSGMKTGVTGRDMGDGHLAPRPPVELYDLAADPNECENLAGRASVAEVESGLAARLQAWMEETDDLLLRGRAPRPPEEAELIARVRQRKPAWHTDRNEEG